jgi:hypothetical protein
LKGYLTDTLLLILGIGLPVFGPGRLAELGKGLDETIRGFKPTGGMNYPPHLNRSLAVLRKHAYLRMKVLFPRQRVSRVSDPRQVSRYWHRAQISRER